MSTSNPTQTIVTNPVDTGNEEYYLWERLTGLLDFGVQSYLIEFEDVNSFFETFNSLQSAEEKNKYIDGLDEAINVKSKIRQAANDINSIEIFRKKVKEIGSQLDGNVRMFFEYLAYTYIGGGEIDAQAKEIIENALAAGAQGTNIEVLQQKVYDIKRDPFRVDQIQRGGAISKGEIQSLLDTLDNDESDVSGRSAESFGVQQPSQPPAQGQVRAPQSGQARPPQNNLPLKPNNLQELLSNKQRRSHRDNSHLNQRLTMRLGFQVKDEQHLPNSHLKGQQVLNQSNSLTLISQTLAKFNNHLNRDHSHNQQNLNDNDHNEEPTLNQSLTNRPSRRRMQAWTTC
jgi:hypothetical protein